MLHYWLLGLALILLIAFYALAYVLREMDEDGDKR